MSKVDIIARIYKMKTELYNGVYPEKSADWHDGAQDTLNKIISIINEYNS